MSDWKKVAGSSFVTVRWEEQAEPGKEEKSTYFGPVIEGVYKNKKENQGPKKNSNIYEIKTETNGLVSVWGGVILDGKFEEIPQGSEVRITHLGMQKTKDGLGEFRAFEVDFREVPTRAAGEPALPTM